MSIAKPIFIVGAHKSGSTLLRCLLDSHPELFVIPFETHFFQNACFWVDYDMRKTSPKPLTITDIKDNYIKQVEDYNTITDYMSDANLVGRFDTERLKNQFMSSQAMSLTDVISSFSSLIYENLHKRPMATHLRVVEKSVEHAEFALDLNHLFPDAKFIHILRNPYANIVSLRRYAGRKFYPFLGRIMRSLKNSYYNLYRNKRLISRYQVVRYEDLISQPADTMKTVVDFLEIDYHETLLQPTVLGKSWKGNSSRKIEFAGISSFNLELWPKEINHLEVFYINKYFQFLLKEYGYQVIHSKKSILVPVPNETPATYVLNRLIGSFI